MLKQFVVGAVAASVVRSLISVHADSTLNTDTQNFALTLPLTIL